MNKNPIIAKRGNVIVSIDDLEQFGENCNCVCLNCEKPLIAIAAGKRRAHFRHKAYQEHCHYDANVALNKYMWSLLENQDIVNDMNLSLESFKFLKIKKNSADNNPRSSSSLQRLSVKNINKTNNTFTVVIDDFDYHIRLQFDKNNYNSTKKDEIILSLSELVDANNLKREDVINTLLKLIKEKNEKIHKENEIERNKIGKSLIQLWTQDTLFLIVRNVETGKIYKITYDPRKDLKNNNIPKGIISLYYDKVKSNYHFASNYVKLWNYDQMIWETLTHKRKEKEKVSVEIKKPDTRIDSEVIYLEPLNIPCTRCKNKTVFRVKLRNGKSIKCKNCGWTPSDSFI